MKDYSNTGVFFDDLDNVGIYVLEKDTHKLLYANRTFKTFFPDYKEGCLCYQALGISDCCGNCPDAGGEDRCACSLNSDYKFNVNEGFWEGSNAVVVTLQPDDKNFRIMQNNLKSNEAVINMMSDALNIGLKSIILDDDGTLTYLNDSLPVLLGYKREEFLNLCGGNFFDAIYQPDRHSAVEKIKKCLDENAEYSCEYRMRAKNGELKWFLDIGKMEVRDDGTIKLTGIVSDITDMKKNMNELEYHAHYDNLTGIYNRNNFYTQTRKLINDNPDKEYAVIRWDISHFKIINDLFGHDEGDKLLRYVAHTLKSLIGERGTYGRFDADIFIMCIETENDNINKIMDTISEKLNDYPVNFEILPCFGIYVIDDKTISVKLMCDRANLAHHTVKGNFITRHAFYSDDLRLDLVKEHEITSEMTTALEQEQFEVYLQPKYDLTYENIIGAEALVRWIHPERGFMPPNMFIPIFERNGFIMKLDEYIWERTCMILRRWMDEGRKVIPISVNISRIDLYNPHLSDFLIDLVEKYDLDPKLLELEITESAYTENSEQLMPVMRKLQQYGFIILMDDFGTGYSSLNMLKDVPVNILKIDMNFLTEDMEHGRGGIILSSIVRMAKWLSLPVVAEGVETNTQVDFLRSIGCNLAQGYYYSRPVPVAEFEKLMDYSKSVSACKSKNIPSDVNLGDLWNPNSTDNILFDNILGAVAMYELNGDMLEIVRANDEYFRIIGIDSECMNKEERNIFAQIHPDDLDMFRRLILSATETRPSSGEFRRLRSDGTVIWLSAMFRVLALTSNGERAIVYGSIYDITIRKQRESKLENDFGYMQKSLLKTPAAIGIFEISEKMRTVFVNDMFCSVLGYTREYYDQNISDDLFKVMAPDNADGFYYTVTNSVLSTLEPVIKFVRSDKTVVRVKMRMTLGKNSGGTLICYAVAMPVSECTDATLLSKNILGHVIMDSVNIAAFEYDVPSDTMKYCIIRDKIYTEYSLGEYLEKFPHTTLFHPEYRDMFAVWLKELCRNGADNTENVELKANFYSDNYVWVRCSAETITDENGEIVNVIGCFHDIQLEKTVSMKTNDTADLLSSAIELMPGGVFKAKGDGDFTLLYANESFYKMRGYTKVEFEQYNKNKAINCIHPDDVEYVRGELKKALAQKKDSLKLETRIVTPSGKAEYDLIKCKIIYHKDVPVIYGTTLNITAEKMLKRQLESQKRYNSVISSNALFYHEADLSDNKVLTSYYRASGNARNTDKSTYMTMIRELVTFIHPDYKESFEKNSNAKNLIYEFENGNKHVTLKYSILNTAQEYSDIIVTFDLRKNPFNGHIESFICGREQDDTVGKNLSVNDKEYHNLITSDLIVSYKINFESNTVEKYKGDDSVIDRIFDFGSFVKRIVARVAQDSQKQCVQNLLDTDIINKRFETSSFTNSVEYVRYDKYGNPVWVRTSLVLAYNESGEKIGFVNIRNISDYKSEQTLQRDLLKRYSTELKNSYDMIYEINFTTDEVVTIDIDDNGIKRIPIADAGIQDILDEFYSRFHTDNNDLPEFRKILSCEFLDELFSGGVNEYHKTAFVRAPDSDEYRWMSYWIRKVRWNDRQDKIFMFYAKDVNDERTEQEKNSRMLKSALLLAEQANKAKSDFLSKVSHDIRTPMNAIMGMASIARDNINDSNKIISCIDSIDESANYLLRLINNVLDMSKIENGKMVISKSEFNICEMINSLRDMFDMYKMDMNIDFSIFTDTNISETVIGDEVHVNQIIINLLANAFQYSRKNGVVKLEVIQVEKTATTEIIKFIVTDNGIGMDSEHLKRIFEPFEQIDGNGSKGGSGLGLAIVHSLVHIMDGVIDVESVPEKGSKFTVTIPFGTMKRKSARNDKNSDSGDYRFNGERILLVEDNKINCEIAKSILEYVNLNVEIAENGKAALDKFSEAPIEYYQAILMDIRMPVMDGREATRQIRALPRADAKTVPIIAMSADAFSEDIKYSQRIGMDDYITKPVNRNHLYRTLKKFLNN